MLNTSRFFFRLCAVSFSIDSIHGWVVCCSCPETVWFLSAPPNNRFKARRPRLRRVRGLNLCVRAIP